MKKNTAWIAWLRLLAIVVPAITFIILISRFVDSMVLVIAASMTLGAATTIPFSVSLFDLRAERRYYRHYLRGRKFCVRGSSHAADRSAAKLARRMAMWGAVIDNNAADYVVVLRQNNGSTVLRFTSFEPLSISEWDISSAKQPPMLRYPVMCAGVSKFVEFAQENVQEKGVLESSL